MPLSLKKGMEYQIVQTATQILMGNRLHGFLTEVLWISYRGFLPAVN